MTQLAFYTNRCLSGYVRGRQMAEYLGRPLDEPYNDDHLCVYVKQWPYQEWPHGSYADILDGLDLRLALLERPYLRGIAFTKTSCSYLHKFLSRSDIVYIPQHHCNFEREVRPDRDVKVVGFIGTGGSLLCEPEALVIPFAEVGFDFRWLIVNRYSQREQIMDFYRQLDIQIYGRRPRYTFRRFKDSLRLVNGASFGIPSVIIADGVELSDNAIETASFEEIIKHCVRLRDNKALYEDTANKLLAFAEPFHIENIAPLFLELER